MNTSTFDELECVRGMELAFSADSLICTLDDGRVISVPLSYYPRLLRATDAQRRDFQWIADGIGIHWPQLDEDLSIRGFLLGRIAPGGERR